MKTKVGPFLAFTTFIRQSVTELFNNNLPPDLASLLLRIVFYAFLAGLQPSIIRAAIMGILVFSSQILGRQSLGAYGLFLAGFIMLLSSPQLASDVGFQLSFATTAGLLYLGPLLNRIGSLNSFIKKFPISSDIVITFSAQVATLPILLATFGTYSLWSIPVNALVLWTIPVLMILGGIGAILGMIFQPLGSILVYLCLPLLLIFKK